MAQHDQVLANQAFPAARADINNALAALFSNSSGSTAPSTTLAGQLWLDTSTTPNILKIRNSANSGWVQLTEVGTADQVSLPGGILEISAGDPKQFIERTGAASNEKLYVIDTAGTSTGGTGRMRFRTLTDAGSTGATIFEVARNGTSLSGTAFTGPVYASVGIFVAAGSSNAFTGTLTPAPSALADGLMVVMRANHTTTGSVTLNLNGLGAVSVRKLGSAQLVSGDIQNGQLVALSYDATNGWWQMVSPVGNSNTFSITSLPSISSLASGDEFPFADVSNSNTNSKTTLADIITATPGRLIGIQAFSSSGTYSKSAGVNSILVVCAGAGQGASGNGSYNSKNYDVTGGNGGTSSFGAECSATGGSYMSMGVGAGGTLNLSGAGAPGGVSAKIDYQRWTRMGAPGGLSIKRITSVSSTYAVTVGAGGAAYSHTNLGTSASGTAGANGYVYVLEYA